MPNTSAIHESASEQASAKGRKRLAYALVGALGGVLLGLVGISVSMKTDSQSTATPVCEVDLFGHAIASVPVEQPENQRGTEVQTPDRAQWMCIGVTVLLGLVGALCGMSIGNAALGGCGTGL
jgi:hypothetical protein